MLINEKKKKKVGIEISKHPKLFIDYSQTIDDVYEDLEDYNPTKKRRVLIVFDDMIADMESNKKLSSIVKRELQQIASSHSPDIDFKDFIKPYKDYSKIIQLYHEIIY